MADECKVGGEVGGEGENERGASRDVSKSDEVEGGVDHSNLHICLETGREMMQRLSHSA